MECKNPWTLPTTKEAQKPLKVYNTLTRSKVPFVPEQQGNLIRWYSCGPTVYDASHMGHARNYVTIDILRRILQDYFGFEIQFIMNITDVDDKIIVRGRHLHLTKQFALRVAEEVLSSGAVNRAQLHQVEGYWRAYVRRVVKGGSFDDAAALPAWLAEAAAAMATVPLEGEAGVKLGKQWVGIQAAYAALQEPVQDASAVDVWIDALGDVLACGLDGELGHMLSDPAISRKLAEFWEASFMEDMDALHVQRPSVLTRVSEYLPEIIQCTADIVAQGYGYASPSGSVYFDTRGFDASATHRYAKLCPNAADRTTALMEEAEGQLSCGKGSEKKCNADFALWKTSKGGEPAWPSPWGSGRPGWAIECSAMAAGVAPGVLDVHSGGIDLAFPHHDNELAQSEAQTGLCQWVNYFFHTGHLTILGHKMSKSLKNFITIREALGNGADVGPDAPMPWTARQLRLLFLQHPWHATLDFKDTSQREVRHMEHLFVHFFQDVAALVRQHAAHFVAAASNGRHHYHEREQHLAASYHSRAAAVDACLRDSFDTPGVLSALQGLVSTVRIYVREVGSDVLFVPLLTEVAAYVAKILRVFGLDFCPSTIAAASETLLPCLDALSSFRDTLRGLAVDALKCKDASPESRSDLAKSILKACDVLRDTTLPLLGVLLQDREQGQAALVKLGRPEDILLEKAAASVSLASPSVSMERLEEKMAKAAVNPVDMFRLSDEFSAWDDQGVPTLDAAGEPLPKSRRKKLIKDWEAQLKRFEKHNAQ